MGEHTELSYKAGIELILVIGIILLLWASGVLKIILNAIA
jgi:hypothetical protein